MKFIHEDEKKINSTSSHILKHYANDSI